MNCRFPLRLSLGLLVGLPCAPAFAEAPSKARPTSELPPGYQGTVFMAPRPGEEDVPDAPSRDSASPSDLDENENPDDEVPTEPEADSPPAETAAPIGRYDDEDAPAAEAYEEYDDGEAKAPNAVFIEGLGPAILYSLNYERVVGDVVAARIGLSYFSAGASSGGTSVSTSVFMVPLTVSWIGLYDGPHGLDLGAGATMLIFSGSGTSVGGVSAGASAVQPLPVVFVGYRFHPVNGAGFHFRIGADMLIGVGGPSVQVLPWGHLSLGAAF